MTMRFDEAKEIWICSVHGEVEFVGWVPCWSGCDDGYTDEYEDDPINNSPGDVAICQECKGNGKMEMNSPVAIDAQHVARCFKPEQESD